jgi:hypothetical protein
MTIEKKADEIVKGILADLSGRRGLRQEWDMIDDEIQEEIIEEWHGIAVGVLSNKYAGEPTHAAAGWHPDDDKPG